MLAIGAKHGQINPRIDTLAKMACCSRRTVCNALAWLRTWGRLIASSPLSAKIAASSAASLAVTVSSRRRWPAESPYPPQHSFARDDLECERVVCSLSLALSAFDVIAYRGGRQGVQPGARLFPRRAGIPSFRTLQNARAKPMDQPIDGRHVSVPAWIECLDDTLNGLVVAALVMASMTQMGLLYQGGKSQFRSFSLACVSCRSGQQHSREELPCDRYSAAQALR
jgi:hypothetical protein